MLNSINLKKWEPLTACFLSAGIFLGVCLLRGISPFGENCFIQIDLFHQYAPFHEELRERLLAGKSLFYSWESGLGKEFITQYAYYTSSPISLLVLVFPATALPHVIDGMIGIKIALAAFLFAHYLKKSFAASGWPVAAFALLYAWCGFNVCYYWNIMWLDAVALFPLVALGIESLVKEAKWKCYLFSLAATIFVNFYIAFLVCIFAVIYFLMQVWIAWGGQKKFRWLWITSVRFAGCSLLAGMATMVLILPTAIGLSQTAVSDAAFPHFELYQNIYQLLSVHLAGAYPVVLGRNQDLPNLYSGILTILLVPCFFRGKKTSLREKVAYGVVIVFLLLCCCLNQLDFLIHGGHFPANLPHRFAFLYSFLLIRMAYKVWNEKETVSIKAWCLITAVIFVCVLIPEYVVVPANRELRRVYSDSDLLFNLFFVFDYILIYQLYTGQWRMKLKTVSLPLLVLVCIECAFSGYQAMNRFNSIDGYTKYMDSMKLVRNELDELEQGDFYRMEFRRFGTINDGALYHYNGVSQFSSLAPGGISEMLGGMGMASTGNSYRYYDPTPLLDGVLGVRYVVNKDHEGSGTTMLEHYDYLKQVGNLWVYRNPQALPLGFVVSDEIRTWDPANGTPFEVQNSWVQCAAGISDPMFTPLSWQEYSVEQIELTMQEENRVEYRVLEPDNLEAIPRIHVKFCSDKHQYLYVYAKSPNSKRLVYQTGKERQDREISAKNSMIDIGWVDEGEIIEVTMELTDRGEFENFYRETGDVYVAAAGYDSAPWNQAYEALSQSPWELEDWGDTWLCGTAQAAGDGMLFTSIPYIKGWTAMVDGIPQEIVPVGGNGVIGIPVSEGNHQVELRFEVPGLKAGALVSLLAVIGITAMAGFERKRRKNSQI